ncbi:MAG TPA: septal ring lytic transglycosylase RlpA family protein [Vicinamibacterales bacterium]|nr:septal ring lytic transglycosylase RlpA family protein [Vicinamibacterales bacterium]
MARYLCWLIAVLAITLSGCASRNRPPTSAPAPTPAATPAPAPTAKPQAVLETREGLASYNVSGFEGKVTASGEKVDQSAMVAAHSSFPFGTVVRVTNLANGRRVIVRIVDRVPAAAAQKESVLIDLSSSAARNLGVAAKGRAKVRLEVLRWGR